MNPIYAQIEYSQAIKDKALFPLVDYYEGQLFNDDGTEKDNANAWIFIQELNVLYPELFAD